MIGGYPLTPRPDGGFVLGPGRLLRLLCVVTGPTYLEDVEAVLQAMGLGPIASSDPAAWEHERPADWPDERPLPPLAVNEAFVRITAGTGALRAPVLLAPDVPIVDGRTGGAAAHVTIARAWDYGQAPPVQAIAGAAPPASAPKKSGGHLPLLAAGGLAVVGIWHHIAEKRRLKRDEQRLHSAEARAQREEIAGDVRRLVRGGATLAEARSAAEIAAEEDDVFIVEEHDELGRGGAR
jgi:hypothetical protein